LSFGLALLMLIDRTDQDGLERDKWPKSVRSSSEWGFIFEQTAFGDRLLKRKSAAIFGVDAPDSVIHERS
jgi:hypothetical protein